MKWIIVLLLVIFSLTANGQFLKYRAFQSKTIYGNAKSASMLWNVSNSVVIIDAQKYTIKVFGATNEHDLMIVNSEGTKRIPEGNLMTFSAVDSEGNRCAVGLMLYDDLSDGHHATLIITYSNVTHTYRLKIL